MVRVASPRSGHAILLTLCTGECLVLEYCITADGCGWLCKPCVEPAQNMGCGQLEPRMERRALSVVEVNKRCKVKGNLDERIRERRRCEGH